MDKATANVITGVAIAIVVVGLLVILWEFLSSSDMD